MRFLRPLWPEGAGSMASMARGGEAAAEEVRRAGAERVVWCPGTQRGGEGVSSHPLGGSSGNGDGGGDGDSTFGITGMVAGRAGRSCGSTTRGRRRSGDEARAGEEEGGRGKEEGGARADEARREADEATGQAEEAAAEEEEAEAEASTAKPPRLVVVAASSRARATDARLCNVLLVYGSQWCEAGFWRHGWRYELEGSRDGERCVRLESGREREIEASMLKRLWEVDRVGMWLISWRARS